MTEGESCLDVVLPNPSIDTCIINNQVEWLKKY